MNIDVKILSKILAKILLHGIPEVLLLMFSAKTFVVSSVMYGLYYVEVCSLYSYFAEGFILNGCCTYQMHFQQLLLGSFLFFFHFFMSCIIIIDLWKSYYPFISGMNPTWLWCMIFLMHCWMWFANILLRILESMLISGIGM